MKSYLQRLESKLNSVISNNDIEVATKSNSASKQSRSDAAASLRDDADGERYSNWDKPALVRDLI